MTNSPFLRAGLLGAFFLGLSAPASFAGFGSVVSSFAVKAEVLPAALAYNGAHVVSSDPASFSDRHWKVWSEQGSIISSFLPPTWAEIHDGAAFDGTYYWGSSNKQNAVFCLTTAGSVIASFAQPYTYGLTWDGHYLWTSDTVSSGKMLRRHTTAGSVVSSFNVPQPISLACDLGWDGAYLWAPDSRGYIYRLTTTGSVVASFPPPGKRTRGCTFDGAYLRLSAYPGSGPWYIYKIDIGPAPAVAPASFGQVKALFR